MRGLLRLGLVGAGRWGRNYIRTIDGLTGLALSRVASRNPDTKGLVPAGCAVAADWRQVVRAAEVDAIIVATPPASHAEIVLASIEAGKPVLVEKPLTLDAGSAERIVSAAQRKSILVMVDHVHLFHPAYRALKHRAMALGPVRAVISRAANRGPYRPDVSVLWDWGPHDVAMCLDLLGAEPEAASAETLERRATGDAVAERLRIKLRFPGDVPAEIELSTLDERERSFEVRFGSQVLRYEDPPVQSAAERPLARAVAEFTQAVIGGTTALDSVRLGAAVVRTLERCEASLAPKSQ